MLTPTILKIKDIFVSMIYLKNKINLHPRIVEGFSIHYIDLFSNLNLSPLKRIV